MRFALGDRVSFRGTVKKERRDNSTEYVVDDLPVLRNAWGKSTTITEGVIVGVRTLSEYKIEQVTEDGDGLFGSPYTRTEAKAVSGTQVRAWLVAWHLQRKPVLVFDTDIENKIPTDEGQP